MTDFPAYLRDVPPDQSTYGTLSYNRRSKCWTIKAEPCVTELAKRLFPGCDGRGRGVARFTAHRRIVGELNWLMQRYPLEIKEADRARWESALDEAREYAVRREQARTQPETAEPPKETFAGELLPFQKQGLAFLLGLAPLPAGRRNGAGQDSAGAVGGGRGHAPIPLFWWCPAAPGRNWRVNSSALSLEGEVPRVHVVRGLKPYPCPRRTSTSSTIFCCEGGRTSAREGFRRSSSTRCRSCATTTREIQRRQPAFRRLRKCSSACRERPSTIGAARSGTWSTPRVPRSRRLGELHPPVVLRLQHRCGGRARSCWASTSPGGPALSPHQGPGALPAAAQAPAWSSRSTRTAGCTRP